MTKIISLDIENIKRIDAVYIKPDGSTVVIGGDNGAGKSSVLDSIMYGLGGGKTHPAKPLRKGTKQGHIRMDLGELIVERSFTEKGSKLEIKSKDGYEAPTPQKILDDMCGKMAFDPLEFSRQKPREQLETLRGLVGLDFEENDRDRQKLYDERTAVNRDAKNAKARVDSMPVHADVPKVEVDVSALMQALQKREQHNAGNAKKRDGAKALIANRDAAAKNVTDLTAQIERLQEQQLRNWKEQLASENTIVETALAEIKALADQNTDEIRSQIETAAATNRKVAENEQRKQSAAKADELEKQSKELTEQIETIDAEKQKAIEGAAFPVDGLGFDADGITFNGLPFSQASSAEQLRVSVAMGLAMNPDLRVMLIRDGSLLDNNSLAMVGEMAEAADAQIWIERVGHGKECSVIIADGALVEEAVKA